MTSSADLIKSIADRLGAAFPQADADQAEVNRHEKLARLLARKGDKAGEKQHLEAAKKLRERADAMFPPPVMSHRELMNRSPRPSREEVGRQVEGMIRPGLAEGDLPPNSIFRKLRLQSRLDAVIAKVDSVIKDAEFENHGGNHYWKDDKGKLHGPFPNRKVAEEHQRESRQDGDYAGKKPLSAEQLAREKKRLADLKKEYEGGGKLGNRSSILRSQIETSERLIREGMNHYRGEDERRRDAERPRMENPRSEGRRMAPYVMREELAEHLNRLRAKYHPDDVAQYEEAMRARMSEQRRQAEKDRTWYERTVPRNLR